jgi:hypothetical protein
MCSAHQPQPRRQRFAEHPPGVGLAQLERHGLSKMGEHGDIDLAASRRILELSVAA